jgi:glutathionyl-hydroquinone reductase
MTVHSGPDDSWHGVVTSDGLFQPEKDRYHLYIGLFCPFAHRANLVRHLKGLQDIISLSVVKPYPKGDDKGWPGWQFPSPPDDLYEGATEDRLFQSKYLHEVYFKDDPDYKGRYSVPVFWDKKENRMVNNESHELLRWLPTAFDSILDSNAPGCDLDLYPENLRSAIDGINVWMQRDLNSGVYKAGFATTQEDYNNNVPTVFAALNKLEALIHQNGGPYILGKQLTEVDIRAYATVVRFDVVYVGHFKCDLGTIRANYPVIHEWLKNLYWNVPGFKETTDFRHIKENVSAQLAAWSGLI